MNASYKILQGDALFRLRELPDDSIHCVVTSPPYYGLRDYGTGKWDGGNDLTCDHKVRKNPRVGSSTLGGGKESTGHQQEGYKDKCGRCDAIRVDDQIGLEETPKQYVEKLVEVFREVRRVLRPDGVFWLNIGDSYASFRDGKVTPDTARGENTGTTVSKGLARNRSGQTFAGSGIKHKDLIGIPWMLAFALRDDGWYLRQDIIWHKPNPMPESVTDRCTKSHEYVFLLTKSPRYFYDAEAIKEPCVVGSAGSKFNIGRVPRQNRIETTSRNKRSVWTIATESFREAHFATFPTKLIEPCVAAGTSEQGCCNICGSPQTRVTEKTAGSVVHLATSKTVGWKPSCACEGGLIPCTVLDPFSGAGTTALVATRMGRSAIGIELNPEYVTMSERRLRDEAPLFSNKM